MWSIRIRWIATIRSRRETTRPISRSGIDGPAEDLEDILELVEDLLEPQLVGLVHDDEQQLVVGFVAEPRRLRCLAAEQAVELEVVVVVHRLSLNPVFHADDLPLAWPAGNLRTVRDGEAACAVNIMLIPTIADQAPCRNQLPAVPFPSR